MKMLQCSIARAEIIEGKTNSHGGEFRHVFGNLVKIQDRSLRDLYLQQCGVGTRLQDGLLYLCSKIAAHQLQRRCIDCNSNRCRCCLVPEHQLSASFFDHKVSERVNQSVRLGQWDKATRTY